MQGWQPVAMQCIGETDHGLFLYDRELWMVFTSLKGYKENHKNIQWRLYRAWKSQMVPLWPFVKIVCQLWIKVFLSKLLTLQNYNSTYVLHFKIEDETKKLGRQGGSVG